MTTSTEQLPSSQPDMLYPTVLPDAPAEILGLFDETDSMMAEAAGTITETRAAIDAFDPIIYDLLGEAGVQIDLLDGGTSTLRTLHEQLDTERASEKERTKESLNQLLGTVNGVIGKAYERYPDATQGDFTVAAGNGVRHKKIDLEYRLFGEEPVILNDFLDAGIHVQVTRIINPPQGESRGYKAGSMFIFTDITSGDSLRLAYGEYKGDRYKKFNGQYIIDNVDDKSPEVTVVASGSDHNLTAEFCDEHATDPSYVRSYDKHDPCISNNVAFREVAAEMKAPGLIDLVDNIYQGRWTITPYGSRKENKQIIEILPKTTGNDMTTQQFNEMVAKVQAIQPSSAVDVLMKYHG